jgi:S-phase kinase-associated protein 1
MSKTVYLVPPEGVKIEVPRQVAEMSVLIREMLADDEEETEEIPLPNVSRDILELVISFCQHHVNNPMADIEKPLKSNNMSEVVEDPWDAEFIDVEQATLFNIILAANYLDLPSLLDLSCAKVASMIKGKSPEEIRKTFNIVNDFTPEEEAQVREENKWCEDS